MAYVTYTSAYASNSEFIVRLLLRLLVFCVTHTNTFTCLFTLAFYFLSLYNYTSAFTFTYLLTRHYTYMYTFSCSASDTYINLSIICLYLYWIKTPTNLWTTFKHLSLPLPIGALHVLGIAHWWRICFCWHVP